MVKVVGLIGGMGSGKDVVSQYLKKEFGCYYAKISDAIRTEIQKKKGTLSRKTLQDLGDELRRKYGTHILAKLTTDYLPRNKPLIIVDGIRNPGEMKYLKETFGRDFVSIAVDRSPELRFENIKKRARRDDPSTLEEFLEDDARDQGINQPEYGQQVRKCIDAADFVIKNDGSFEEFQTNIVETVNKALGNL
jgi:dephospho-CoA kinase